jgi:uncharacterized membrane protein HdeD (DUF308 family)
MSQEIHLPSQEEILEALRPHRTALILAGLIQGLLGVAAVAAPHIATEVGTALFGFILLLAGGIQLAQSSRIKGWKGTSLMLFGGLLDLVMAGALLVFPHRGAIALTLVLAVLLFCQGVVRMIFSFRAELPAGRGWFFLGGASSAVLGGLLWWEWPADSVWAIGLLLGVNLLLSGLSLVGLAGSLGGSDSGASTTTS